MTKLLATLCLATALGLPLAARADEAADRIAVAKDLVQKTVVRTLETGFGGALEKTVAAVKDESRADQIRKEARAEFDTQRTALIDGLSKEYADKFTLDELKRLQAVYDDKTYQKFQAINADPASAVTTISQNVVTRLLNMLTLAAAGDQGDGAPGGTPGPGR